jgi:hypothetical protein
MVIWQYPQGIQKEVIELKILYRNLERTISQGLEQVDEYFDRCSQKQGHLVIFDRRESITWDEKIFRKQKMYNNKTITVWGM